MAIDIDQSFYRTGTATVAANGTAVTGQGTLWTQTVRKGDMFGTHVGMPTRILSVNSNTSLTLAYPWKGPAQTASAYEIQFTPYDVGYQASVRELLLTMASGNVDALAGLTGAQNTMPYFTGVGTMARTSLTAWARTLLEAVDGAAGYAALGNVPDERISETLSQAKSYRRGNVIGAVSQSGGIPTGYLMQRGGNANGEFARYADGTQICWRYPLSVELVAVTEAIGSSFRGATVWNYPSTFSTQPSVVGSVIEYRGGSITPSTRTTTFVNLNIVTPISHASGVAWSAVAIGRWF